MADQTDRTPTDDHLFCAHCGTENAKGVYACTRCGERLVEVTTEVGSPVELVSCARCGSTNNNRAAYCWTCGTEMHDAIRISPTPQAKPAGAARPYEPDLNPVSAPTSDPKDDRVDLRGPASSPISGAPGREAGPAPPPDSGFGIPDEPVTNTSGMRGAEIPEQLRKWNWAAFLVPDIWGVFNGVPWTLALLVLVIVPFIPFEMRFVLVVGARIFLGLRGNQLAWQGKKWRSEAHFQVVQRRWLTVSVILMGILLVLIFTSPESFTDGQQGQ